MKDLIISWNEKDGFYCDEFKHQMFFVVLANLIQKFNLKTNRYLKSNSETEMYLSTRELNLPDYNLILLCENLS